MSITVQTDKFKDKYNYEPGRNESGHWYFADHEGYWSYNGKGPYSEVEKAAKRAYSIRFETQFGYINLVRYDAF